MWKTMKAGVVLAVVMGMGLLAAPEARGNTALMALNLRLDGLAKKAAKANVSLAKEIKGVAGSVAAMQKVLEKCLPDGGCKPKTRSRARNTVSKVKSTVTKCMNDPELKADVGVILQILTRIENDLGSLHGEHGQILGGLGKVLENQDKFLEKINQMADSGHCFDIPRYVGELSKEIQAAIAGTVKSVMERCEPDRTEIAKQMVAHCRSGVLTRDVLVLDPGNGTCRNTKQELELDLLDYYDTTTADVLMGVLPVLVGGAAGYGIGVAARPQELDLTGEEKSFIESGGGIGLLVGAGVGLLTTVIYFAVRPSARERVDNILFKDRLKRLEVSSSATSESASVRFTGFGLSATGSGGGFSLSGSF